MREIRTSGLMSGEGKRSFGQWLAPPRPSSTLQIKGRKVHALVDTEGLPLRVVVHSAAIQDRDGAALVFDRIRQRFNWLELVWADGGYNARQVEHAVAAQPPLRVEIVKRPDDSAGFIVLPRRWVVERDLFLVRPKPPLWPRTTRTSPTPSPPSSPSPASNSPSGGSPGRRLLSSGSRPIDDRGQRCRNRSENSPTTPQSHPRAKSPAFSRASRCRRPG